MDSVINYKLFATHKDMRIRWKKKKRLLLLYRMQSGRKYPMDIKLAYLCRGEELKDNVVIGFLVSFALYYVFLEYLASCCYYEINKIQIVSYIHIASSKKNITVA